MIMRTLWRDLGRHKAFSKDSPWVIMRDFNSALNLEDKLVGSSKIDAGMRDFKACVDEIEVMDVNKAGMHYTWNQKPRTGVGILKKIDRVLANTEFIHQYEAANTVFLPYRVSDHSPCILNIPCAKVRKPRPFKFANLLIFKQGF